MKYKEPAKLITGYFKNKVKSYQINRIKNTHGTNKI